MKTLTNCRLYISFLMLNTLFALTSYAQEKKMDVDISVNKSNTTQWYTQPWAWIVGGAVFILLLVAIMRSGQKS